MGALELFIKTREMEVDSGRDKPAQPMLPPQASLRPMALPEVTSRHPRQDGTQAQSIKGVKQAHHRAGQFVKEISRHSAASQEVCQGPGSLTPRRGGR